jgi:hypothetical protein
MALASGTQNALQVALGLVAGNDVTTTVNAQTPNIVTAGATALTVAATGVNYIFQVDTSTASAVVGLKVKGAAAGAGVALSVIGGNAAENFTIDAEGAGVINIGGTSTGIVVIGRGAVKGVVESFTKTTINAQSGTPTAAQLLGGYIDHNSQTGAGTLTFPTSASIDTAIAGAAVGDSFCFFYVNRGNQTVTLTANADATQTLRGTVAVPTLKNAWITFVRTGAATYDVLIDLSA